MEIVEKIVAIVAVCLCAWQLFGITITIKNGDIISPPMVAAALIFLLFLVVVLLTKISNFHLLWLFPLSFLLGVMMMFSSWGQKIVMGFILVLHRMVNK